MSLLAWYPLIKDGINQGLDGVDLTTVGTVTYTAGKLGNAATFTQNLANYLRRPQIKINDNFSFACWFKLDTTESTTWQTLLFEGRDANSDGWGFRINGSTKRVLFCCGSTAQTYNTDLPMGTWHHVCMTVQNSVWTGYVDGVQIGTGTVTTLPALTEWGTYFFVGCLTGNYYPLMGQVQDVRIYDHPLSKKEVKELAKGLCLHLPLDWGGNPNMIKNSYTWMNKAMGTTNGTSTTMVVTKSIIIDDYAPCKNVLKVEGTNSGSSNTGTSVGPFFGIGIQGLTTDDLVSGETYTYSFWAKLDPSSTGNISFNPSAICESQTKVSDSGFGNLTTNWRKHTVTFNWTSTAKLTACFYTSYTANTSATYYLCGIKLEKGQKATPYIPHVEETEYSTLNFGEAYKVDCSGYNHTMSVSGSGISNTQGSPRGTGTTIAQNGKFTIANGMTIGTFPSFTVNAWIRTKADTTYSSWYDFFGISANNASGSNSLFRMEVANTAGTAFNWFGPMQKDAGGLFNTTISTGQWYMITLVSDGAKLYGYKDSVLYGTFTPEEAKLGWSTTGTFYIGDTNIWFDVADARIYATALSADDIKELYQVGAQIDKSGNFYCNKLVEV